MKSFLIIGMGRFGHHITINLARQGAEIMIVDTDQAKMEDLLSVVTSAKIGDCTNEEVLKTLGVKNFIRAVAYSKLLGYIPVRVYYLIRSVSEQELGMDIPCCLAHYMSGSHFL